MHFSIHFLWDAFETNYTYGKYQFAFLAYHMLTMSFIYFNIWQIKLTAPEDFANAMVGFNKDLEKELMNATTPFTFWRINESSVMRFLKLIGCDNDKVGSYAALVKERNDTAHTNGNIFFSTEVALDTKIREIIRVVEEIQAHSISIIQSCYTRFLVASSDADIREYFEDADQIREILIHPNYLSLKDIDHCANTDITKLATRKNFRSIQSLHESLCTKYLID